MLNFDAVEDVCERMRVTLVIHPVIRRALRGYEESFYIGLRCFLDGTGDGVFYLPLEVGGFERLVFSKRWSSRGFRLLRVDPLRVDGLDAIQSAARNARARSTLA